MRKRVEVGVVLGALLVVTSGCSVSNSIGSISGSVSDSVSSVSSSSPGGSERAYKTAVRDYVETFVHGGGDPDKMRPDLGKLAEKHGITNWEENLATYEGIGAGLARAKVTETQLMAYKRSLGDDNTAKIDAIQKGYDAEH